MLTAMPTNTAVCRTSTLTPSVTIGFPPEECFDETVADRCDHVAAGEYRTARLCTRVNRREEFVRRRVFHLRQLIAGVPVANRRADECFRVPTRHNDATKVELAGQRTSKLDAPGRTVVSAVEQPDERSTIEFLSTDEFPSQFEEGIDIVHPERADERVDARMVPPFEELHGPVIRS